MQKYPKKRSDTPTTTAHTRPALSRSSPPGKPCFHSGGVRRGGGNTNPHSSNHTPEVAHHTIELPSDSIPHQEDTTTKKPPPPTQGHTEAQENDKRSTHQPM